MGGLEGKGGGSAHRLEEEVRNPKGLGIWSFAVRGTLGAIDPLSKFPV